MLFNSIDFAIFLPLVFILHWVAGRTRARHQNLIIVIASYVFYAWWDWRFLSLILISTVVDFIVGRRLLVTDASMPRRVLLLLSLFTNLGLLAFFKYFDFFVENFVAVFSFFGASFQADTLNIVLPVGISFYTFQTLSYTIDIYRRKIDPTQDFIAFAAFVSFFPQLVAGPIERAKNLLPQFSKCRRFDYQEATDGMRQILWGLFKKIVIADNCASYVELVFANPAEHSGSTLFVAAILFAFQIYCDFSGYSDIAIGVARLFGIRLMQNFAFPYFSRNIGEFWRRWHISLSTWFRDYVFIPLGGSRTAGWKTSRNILIVFMVSGLWHGANWTFVAWGLLHALYYLAARLMSSNTARQSGVVAEGALLPSLRELTQIVSTFSLVTLAWIFFRSAGISDSLEYLSGIFSLSFFSIPRQPSAMILFFLLVFLLVEWLGRGQQYAIAKLNFSTPVRWLVYYSLLISIFVFGGSQQQFIYFQF